MQHISIAPFGRPLSAGLLAARALAQGSAEAPPAPKWQVLRDLTTARKRFGVNDRDLAVLQALLSFLPADDIAPGESIVFPSNASLAARAHGMPESTLRRHLAALVSAGLIRRNDSPNGKRYAARDRSGSISRAFGFDLSPLAHRAAEIAQRAQETQEAEAELRRLRELAVLALRDASLLLAHALECGATLAPETTESLMEMRKALRRKADVSTLHAIIAKATATTEQLSTTLFSEELSGKDVQNERHIQFQDKPMNKKETLEPRDEPHVPRLETVLAACPSVRTYIDTPIADWRSFISAIQRLAPMIGIPVKAWDQACTEMSPSGAATTIACMLQKLPDIRRPTAYIRTLTRKAAEGTFTPMPMVTSLLHRAS